MSARQSDPRDPLSRREFTRMAVGAAVVPAAVAVAQAAPADKTDGNAKPGDPPRPPHELLVDVLRARFPHEKLTPDILDLIRADIAGDLGRCEALAQFELKNSDEPGFVFSP